MSNILITGSEGFIGSRLTYEQLGENVCLYGYDLVFGHDIRDKYKLEDWFQKYNFDTVIHLAARAGVRMGEQYSEEFISTNINGTKNLLDMSAKYGIKHFIFFSSSSVYGTQRPPNKETDELQPIGVYGASKALGEMLVKSSGVPYTIIRPFTVYGENGRLDQVIFKWINQIKSGIPITKYGDGSSKRGYTYVGDLVNGVMKVLRKGAENEIYNLGGSEIVTLNELAELFSPYTKEIKKMPKPKEDIKDNWGDISKAEKKLWWSPGTNFNDKVKQILENEFNK